LRSIAANRIGLNARGRTRTTTRMKPAQLFLLSGIAAIAGGVARIAVSFAIITDAVQLEWLYTAIDILLLFGIIGIYLQRAERLGFLGLSAFVIAVAALSFIGGPDADPFGFSTYEQGATTLAIALIGLSIAWVRVGERPLAAPLCWFLSVIAVGVLGLLPATASYGLTAAGVLFGAGFVFAGLALTRNDAVAPHNAV
jgi:hypothetical protein